MPKKERPQGLNINLLDADAMENFVFGMEEKMRPKERAGFIDNVFYSGIPFKGVRTGGDLNYEFEGGDELSLANMLKTADFTTLVAFASIPFRLGEVAYLTSKSLYHKFQEQYRAETEAAKKVPFVYNKYTSSKNERGKSTLTEEDLRGLYGDRVTNILKIRGDNYGNPVVNFPGYGRGRGVEEGHGSESIDEIVFGPNSKGKYTFEVKGPIKEARVKRAHSCGG
jgi:hypothetical protein